MPLFIIFALVIAFFAIAFALQNNQLVTINFLVWQIEREPLATVLLGVLALGVVIGLLVAAPAVLKRGWRISRTKKQASSLEDQLAERQKALNSQTQKTETLRHTYQNLLQALDLLDPHTGLVSDAVLPRATRALLQQMKIQPLNERFQAVAILFVRPHSSLPNPGLEQERELWSAIAARIQGNITVDTWLFSNNDGQFTCILPGLDVKAVTKCAETLKTSLEDEPLTLGSGLQTAIDAAIGGAVADVDHPTESEQLLIDKAEEALEASENRSRRVRVIRVTD